PDHATVELVGQPFRSYLPPDANDSWWVAVKHGLYYEPMTLYSAGLQLGAEVVAAAATLPGAVVAEVRTVLQGVRDKLRLRDFAAAADKAAKAADALELAGARVTLRMSAKSLANLNGSASAGVSIA